MATAKQRGKGRPVQKHAVIRRFQDTDRELGTKNFVAVWCRCGKTVVGYRGFGKRTAEFAAKQLFNQHKAS